MQLACLGPRLPPPLQSIPSLPSNALEHIPALSLGWTHLNLPPSQERLSSCATVTAAGLYFRSSPDPTPTTWILALAHHDPDAPLIRVFLKWLTPHRILCREACCLEDWKPTDASRREPWWKRLFLQVAFCFPQPLASLHPTCCFTANNLSFLFLAAACYIALLQQSIACIHHANFRHHPTDPLLDPP